MEKLRAMVDRDERQIQSLIRLIEDMLDVSRIRTGKLSIRTSAFDLAELVSNLLESFSAQIAAAESSVTFKAEEPVIGVWDEFRIEQVIANLLTNALRYGARKPIKVRVYAEDGEARVEVHDQALVSARKTSSGFFSNSNELLPTMRCMDWASVCLSLTRLSLLMVGALLWKAQKAKALCSGSACRFSSARNQRQIYPIFTQPTAIIMVVMAAI